LTNKPARKKKEHGRNLSVLWPSFVNFRKKGNECASRRAQCVTRAANALGFCLAPFKPYWITVKPHPHGKE
jgi:hypothetical protein